MKKTLYSIITFTMFTFSLCAVPKAIVFDFGGVMTTEANHSARVSEGLGNFIKNSFDLSDVEFETMNQQRSLAVQQGQSDEQFLLLYAERKGIKLPPNWSEAFKSTVEDAVGMNSRMYDLTEELTQKNIRVGLLSNSDGNFSQLLRECGIYEPFNPCLLSCEIGIKKPDLKAYEVLLTKLKLPAKDVIFVDDKAENIDAAKIAGLDAILFESERQLRHELSQRGILE